jgi:hypothetical protein
LLFRVYLLAEDDDESILHPGDYEPRIGQPLEPVGESVADLEAARQSVFNIRHLPGFHPVSSKPISTTA